MQLSCCLTDCFTCSNAADQLRSLLCLQIVLGVVKIASSHVESVEEICTRLKQVLTVLPAERLIVAPDCGLGFLPTELAKQKLYNMVQAAKSLP